MHGLLFLEIQWQSKLLSVVTSFVQRFLFQQSCVAQHLFARRNAEFFQNIVVVEFERTFLNVANYHNFVGGFAVKVQFEYLFFPFW